MKDGKALHYPCHSLLAMSNPRWKPLAVQLFASSQLESEDFSKMEDLANHMGLFLQKTNIIRDYLEDINEEPAPRYLNSHYASCLSLPKSCCLHILASCHSSASPHSRACVAQDSLHIYMEYLNVFAACFIGERLVYEPFCSCVNWLACYAGCSGRGRSGASMQRSWTTSGLPRMLSRPSGA